MTLFTSKNIYFKIRFNFVPEKKKKFCDGLRKIKIKITLLLSPVRAANSKLKSKTRITLNTMCNIKIFTSFASKNKYKQK